MNCLTSLLLLSALSSAVEDGPFLLECRVPENVGNFSLRVNLTKEEQEQLLFEGRCVLACATEEFNNEVK